MKKRVLIDVNSAVPYFMTGRVSGIGRTTVELVNALSEIGELPFDIELFSQNMKGVGGPQFKSKFKTLHIYLPYRLMVKKICNFFRVIKLLSRYSLMHIPHNTDFVENLGETIFTIHDLIVYRYPEMWGLTDLQRAYHKQLIRDCKAVFTCSESSRQDIINFLECDPSKVYSIPWGINRGLFIPANDVDYLRGLGVVGDYYFCASCNHPRKNLKLLLDSFSKYIKLGGFSQLVLLNPLMQEVAQFEDLIEENKIVVCNKVSDKELCLLYSGAKASIVVSVFEGFGLPVLESLSCQTAVLCANNSSLTEAGGEVVDYFERLDADVIADKMFLYDAKLKADTLNRALVESHLSNFTWEKCANGYVDAWCKLLDV